jgi:hypothetical protein
VARHPDHNRIHPRLKPWLSAVGVKIPSTSHRKAILIAQRLLREAILHVTASKKSGETGLPVSPLLDSIEARCNSSDDDQSLVMAPSLAAVYVLSPEP